MRDKFDLRALTVRASAAQYVPLGSIVHCMLP